MPAETLGDLLRRRSPIAADGAAVARVRRQVKEYRAPISNRSIGIEIECLTWPRIPLVSWNSRLTKQYPEYNKHYGFFYAKMDGSIEGEWDHPEMKAVEWVSQPLTAEWLKKEIARHSQKFDWITNYSCGIHLHVSREWLTRTKARKIYDFYNQLTEDERRYVFGRASNTYCKANNTDEHSRYRAINLTNKATIEFRMFASGDWKWAQYCVDCVVYMIKHANQLNTEAILAFRASYRL